MLHVAFPELPPGGSQQVFANESRPRHRKRQHVLELVTETECASGLVQGGTGPQATGQRLIHQPAVQQEIHRGIRRLDLDRLQDLVPEILDLAENRVAAKRPVFLDQRAGLVAISPFAQQELQRHLFAGLELDARLQRGARIQASAGPSRQPLPALQ